MMDTQDLTGQVIKAARDYFAHGASGDIWKATWIKNDSEIAAVKVPRVILTDPEDLANCTKRTYRETKAWSAVNHRNITPFYGISSDFHRAPTPCLVSPYCRNGDITTYLKGRPNVDRMQLITQVAMALSYLHNLPRPIIHGNVNASNILINDNLEASLFNFSQSRFVEAGKTILHPLEPLPAYKYEEAESISQAKTTESWRWKAYELVAPCVQEGFVPRVTAATDVWSFAMSVIEILTGQMPFSHLKSDTSVILAIASGERPKRDTCPHIDDKVWAMLERCWNVDTNQRPSMAILARFFASQSGSPSIQLSRL